MSDKPIKDLKESKPKIDIQEVKRLYEVDMKKASPKNYVDFKDYCKEIAILFEINY